MVNDRERKYATISDYSKSSVICALSDRIAPTTAFVTPVVEREIYQWVDHERTLYHVIFTERHVTFHAVGCVLSSALTKMERKFQPTN